MKFTMEFFRSVRKGGIVLSFRYQNKGNNSKSLCRFEKLLGRWCIGSSNERIKQDCIGDRIVRQDFCSLDKSYFI